MGGHDMMQHLLARTGGYPVDRAIVIVQNGVPQVVAFVRDLDGNVLRLCFDAGGMIAIDSADHAWLFLDAATLQQIGRIAEEARSLAADIARCWDDARETWVGHEYLLTHPHPIDLHETLA